MSILAKSKGEVSYKDITTAHKWGLVILISIGSSVVYTPMYLKSIFYDQLMEALGCTNADLGLMVTCFGLAAMICYFPSGILADKIRMRTLATVGFIGTAVLVFIYAALPSIEICLLLFVLMGVTAILIWWGTRFKVIRLCCEENEYASKIGISYSIYGVTALVGGLINAAVVAALSTSVSTAFGIQVMLIVIAVELVVLGILAYIMIPDFKDEISDGSKFLSVSDIAATIKHPGVLWACAAYFCVYAVYQGATYTTPYLTACFGADANLVNVVGLIRTAGIGLLAGPIIGFIATKIKSPSKTIIGCFVLTIAMLIAFVVYPQEPDGLMVAVVMVIVFGFATYGAYSIGSSPLSEIKIPMRIFGTAAGLLSVIGYLPDVFIHTWFGSMIDASGTAAYSSIFGVEIVLSIIGMVCFFMLTRSVKKHFSDAQPEQAGQTEQVAE